MLGDVGLLVFEARAQTNRATSPLLSVFRAYSKKDHELSAEPHNTHPSPVNGWSSIYFGLSGW